MEKNSGTVPSKQSLTPVSNNSKNAEDVEKETSKETIYPWMTEYRAKGTRTVKLSQRNANLRLAGTLSLNFFSGWGQFCT